MKFHGIAMAGPFVNQKLSSLPVFDAVRDQGRMVWITDGTIWYGSDIEWVNFSSGSGDASEVEDLYSDLLRTTIFLNASYDGFIDIELPLVESKTMTHSVKNKLLSFTAGQQVTSKNLLDPLSGVSYVDYLLAYIDFTDSGPSPIFQISTNNGATWQTVSNGRMVKVANVVENSTINLRFTGSGSGVIHSWGVLYNKDLEQACSKYGLTYRRFESNEAQTNFELDYVPNAVQVFVNGNLMDEGDFNATNGTDIIFTQPLKDGDIVYVLSYSTSIINPNTDFDAFIRKDGIITYIADQSMGNHKLTNVEDGVDDGDAVNVGQLNSIDYTPFIRHNGSVVFSQNQSMGGKRLIGVANGVDNSDAVNVSQLGSKEPSIGNPASNGMVLSSTTSGVRSWRSIGSTVSATTPKIGGISGGNITYIDDNNLLISPISCLDSTGTVDLYTTTDRYATLPVAIVNQILHIFVVRLVSDGSIVFKIYTTEAAAASDGSINAYRWMGYWVGNEYNGGFRTGYSIDDIAEFSNGITVYYGIYNQVIDISGFIPMSRTSMVAFRLNGSYGNMVELMNPSFTYWYHSRQEGAWAVQPILTSLLPARNTWGILTNITELPEANVPRNAKVSMVRFRR